MFQGQNRKQRVRKFTWTFCGGKFSVKICLQSGALFFTNTNGQCFQVLLEDFFNDALARKPKERPHENGESFKLTPYARRLLKETMAYRQSGIEMIDSEQRKWVESESK